MKLITKFAQTLSFAFSAMILPIFLIQAFWVKLTVLRLPEPSGQRSGRCGDGKVLKLLIIGDSAAIGVGVDEQKDALAGQLSTTLAAKHEVYWRLIANTGFTSADIIKELKTLTKQKYDYVLVSVGVNDVTHLKRVKDWTTNLKAIADLLNFKFGAPIVLLTNIPPMNKFTAIPFPLNWCLGLRAQKFNKLMINLARNYDCCSVLTLELPFNHKYIAKDGFHPSKLAYSVWAKQAAEKIASLD